MDQGHTYHCCTTTSKCMPCLLWRKKMNVLLLSWCYYHIVTMDDCSIWTSDQIFVNRIHNVGITCLPDIDNLTSSTLYLFIMPNWINYYSVLNNQLQGLIYLFHLDEILHRLSCFYQHRCQFVTIVCKIFFNFCKQ